MVVYRRNISQSVIVFEIFRHSESKKRMGYRLKALHVRIGHYGPKTSSAWPIPSKKLLLKPRIRPFSTKSLDWVKAHQRTLLIGAGVIVVTGAGYLLYIANPLNLSVDQRRAKE